jgi:branched-chain amino acid transport system permease protein
LNEIPQAVVSGLLIGAIYGLVAVGLTLIFGVMDIVNFAHGNFVMVAMYVTFFSWDLFRLDPLLAIPIAAVFTAGLGAVTYVGAIRHVLRGPALAQIIVTFGLLVLLQGAAQALFSANARGIPHPLADSFKLQLAGVVGGGPQLVAALGAVLCTGGVWALVNRTEVGSAIAAVAQDADAARLVGIDPNRIHLLAWAIGGASVGIAGALLMNFFSVDPVAGASFGLIAFVAVSLGGFGSLPGALVAGVALGVIQDLVGLYLPSYSLAAIFALYLVIVLVRPQGLFGTR